MPLYRTVPMNKKLQPINAILKYLLLHIMWRLAGKSCWMLVSHRWGPKFAYWWTKRSLGRFFSGFIPFSPTRNFIPPFPHTHLTHFVQFYFIRLCDGTSGVVGRHPCYSKTFSKGALSYLVPRPGPLLDTSWGYMLYFLITYAWKVPKKNVYRYTRSPVWIMPSLQYFVCMYVCMYVCLYVCIYGVLGRVNIGGHWHP